MSVVLEIIDGPGKGRRMELEGGQFIGRQGADAVVEDPKMSSKHAQLVLTDDGDYQLKDNKSTNGIKVNGKKVKILEVSPGVLFKMGQTTLKIVAIHAAAIEISEPSISAPPTEPSIPVPPPPPETWDSVLEKFAQQSVGKIKNVPAPLSPFQPSFKLQFVRGPQVEMEWTLGYGPRKIGPASPDLPIIHEDAPDICFELLPVDEGCRFTTEHTKVVKMNGEAKAEHLLRDGDEISIHNILIRVKYEN